MTRYLLIFLSIILVITCFTCNPFAPGLETDLKNPTLSLADQKSIEGVFQNLKYSYVFKDTLYYGRLLTSDFVFIYRDYENSMDISWGRDEDIQITNRLFQNSQNLDLVWNEIFSQSGDSTFQNVIRFFNLSIFFGNNEIIRLDGKVNLTLIRESQDEVWKIRSWRDESNY